MQIFVCCLMRLLCPVELTLNLCEDFTRAFTWLKAPTRHKVPNQLAALRILPNQPNFHGLMPV